MTNSELKNQLDALERAYFGGTSEVTIGEQTVKYASMDALWSAIQRLRSQLAPTDEGTSSSSSPGGRRQAVAGRGYMK